MKAEKKKKKKKKDTELLQFDLNLMTITSLIFKTINPTSANESCYCKSMSKFMFLSSFLLLSIGYREVNNLKKPYGPPREVHVQVTHSMAPEKIEIFKSLNDWAEKNLLVLLKPVESSWQPSDFLPLPESEGFYDQVKELRERCKELSDDYFVVLVGDMITEEALPTY